jgi:predicted permease
MAIFIVSVVIHVLTAAIAFLYFKPLKNNEPRKVYEMAMIFSNCAFLGYPVLKVVFGDELGVFYGTFYGIFFTIFIWTYGVYLMSRKDKENKGGEKFKLPASKIFLNAGMISSVIGIIFFVFRLKLPGVLYDSSKLIGDMTFPLSMIIIGSLISDMKLKEMFFSVRNYYYVFFKLLLFPVFIAVTGYILKLPPLLIYMGTLMTAMPSGANVGIFAETYGADSKLAAICVGLSTLLSIGSIPLIMFFLSNVLKV